MKIPLRFLVVPSALLLLAGAVRASDTGSDNAANYGTSWSNGDNRGTGFAAWALTPTSGSGFAGFFIGSSTNLSTNNGGGANINSGNSSFGLYANPTNSGAQALADRSFANGALVGGQEFTIDIAVNYRNGSKGFNLRDAGNNAIFTFNVTADDYKIQNTKSVDFNSIGSTYSANTGFHLDFSQTSTDGGTWTVTRLGDTTGSASGTYAGDAASFRLFVNATDGGGENNFYANNLSITGVPEPATWLGGVLVSAAAGWRWRRPRARRSPVIV